MGLFAFENQLHQLLASAGRDVGSMTQLLITFNYLHMWRLHRMESGFRLKPHKTKLSKWNLGFSLFVDMFFYVIWFSSILCHVAVRKFLIFFLTTNSEIYSFSKCHFVIMSMVRPINSKWNTEPRETKIWQNVNANKKFQIAQLDDLDACFRLTNGKCERDRRRFHARMAFIRCNCNRNHICT